MHGHLKFKFILNIFGCHKYFKKHKLDGLTDVKIHIYGVITCATI